MAAEEDPSVPPSPKLASDISKNRDSDDEPDAVELKSLDIPEGRQSAESEDDEIEFLVTPGSPPPTSGPIGFGSTRLLKGQLDEKTGTYDAIYEQQESVIPPKKASSIPEAVKTPRGALDVRKDKRALPEFVYTYDFDESGIIHYLGTNRWTKKVWSNPALLGLIQLTSSEMNPDSQPLHTFIGRDPCRSLLANIPNSWFTIDFKEHVVVPVHYTLRHYASQDSHALRNWRFEGSNDGEMWDVLRMHKSDKSLNKRGASHTWALDTYSVTKHKSKAYRQFRLQMIGENSSDYFRNLCCSGFEIYGFLFEIATIELDEENPEEIWLETPTPVGERRAELGLNDDDIEQSDQCLREMKEREEKKEGKERGGGDVKEREGKEKEKKEEEKEEEVYEFFQCELFKNEMFTDLKGKPKEKKIEGQAAEDLLSQQIAEDMTSRLGTGPVGVRFINDPKPPELSDEQLRELLARVPKPILRDPRKGYKKNRRNIIFADEAERAAGDEDDLNIPKLMTVILMDSAYLHHGKTRGRKCPNASRRESTFAEEPEYEPSEE